MAPLDDVYSALALDQAQKQMIAGSDPYLGGIKVADSLGQSIASAGPQYSLRDKLVYGALSGLFSGGLTDLSQDYQSRANTAYQDSVLGTMAGKALEKPSVLSDSLFRSAGEQGKMALFKNKLSQLGDMQEIAKAGALEASKERGKLSVYGVDPSGAGGSLMNPALEKAAEQEKFARDSIKTAPIGTQFQDIKSNFDTMLSNYKNNDRYGTLAMLYGFSKVLDPGSSVQEGQLQTAVNTQSYLNKLGYSLSSLIDGTQQVGPDLKQEMIRAGAEKLNAFGQDYDAYVNKQKDLVKAYNGNPDRVFGTVEYKPFVLKDWLKTATQKTLAEDLADTGETAVIDPIVPGAGTSPKEKALQELKKRGVLG